MWKMTILCLAVVLTACSQDTPPEDSPAPTQASSGVQGCEERTPPAPPQASADTVGKERPEVQEPEGPPPCELVIQDIAEGTGAEVKEDSTLTVQYVGVSWSTGEEFEASWDGPEPATFPLSGVIRGWQQGLVGMKEGGRRQLIIPPDLAYGPQGRPGIAPNETLVFVIDILKVA
jgi:peptidylprolyl isomerase